MRKYILFIILSNFVCIYCFGEINTSAYMVSNGNANYNTVLYSEKSISDTHTKVIAPPNFEGRILLDGLIANHMFYNETIDYRFTPAKRTYTPITTMNYSGSTILDRKFVYCNCLDSWPNWCRSNCNSNQVISSIIPAYDENRITMQMQLIVEVNKSNEPQNYEFTWTKKITVISQNGTVTSEDLYSEEMKVKVYFNKSVISHYVKTGENSYKLLSQSESSISNDTNKPLFKTCSDSDSSFIVLTSSNLSLEYAVAVPSINGIFMKKIYSSKDSVVFKLPHFTPFETSVQPNSKFNIKILSSLYSFDYYLDIQVLRPPILFVHGLWSKASAYDAMISKFKLSSLYSSNTLYAVDYQKTNDLDFQSNASVVPNGIDFLLKKVRNNGIAASKVDVVGHSMGGILTRLYLQSNLYKNDINRIITINTPHSGSPLSNIFGNGTRDFLLDQLNDDNEFSTRLYALSDLSVNSPAIDNVLNGNLLNKNIVPTHTITTTSNSTQLSIPSGFSPILYPLSQIFFNFGYPNIFNNEQNDLVVGLSSQIGGIVRTTNIPNQGHIGSQKNISVVDSVYKFLSSTNLFYYSFSGFQPPNLSYKILNNDFTNTIKTSQLNEINIIQPIENTTFSLGQQIPIDITSTGLTELNAFIEYDLDSVYIAKSSSNGLRSQINVDNKFYLGFHDVTVIGKKADGEMIQAKRKIKITPLSGIYSVRTGNWLESESWNKNRIPSILDTVSILPNHKITLGISQIGYGRFLNTSSGSVLNVLNGAKLNINPIFGSNVGLVCFYPFNGNANDESGNNFNGTVNGATLTNDRFGQGNKAMLFDGNDKISVPNFNQITGNSPRTISVWVKTTQNNEHNYWIYWGAYSDNASSVLGNLFSPPATNYFGFLGWSNDTNITNSAHYDNSWHQVVVSHDGLITKLFIDGVLKTQRTLTRPYQTGIDKLTIGCSIADHAFFKGTLDDIKIFNRCLSDDEIVQLYNLEK